MLKARGFEQKTFHSWTDAILQNFNHIGLHNGNFIHLFRFSKIKEPSFVQVRLFLQWKIKKRYTCTIFFIKPLSNYSNIKLKLSYDVRIFTGVGFFLIWIYYFHKSSNFCKFIFCLNTWNFETSLLNVLQELWKNGFCRESSFYNKLLNFLSDNF